jgi:hypothetical protein
MDIENRYELWKVDEYGHGAILGNGSDYEELVGKAKDFVNTDNIENALAGDEKLKNWESFLVEVLDDNQELIDNALYAGKNGSGKHLIQLIVDGEVEEALLNDTDVDVRIFIGRDDKGVIDRGASSEKRLVEDIFATDVKRVKDDTGKVSLQSVPVSEINDRALEGKTAYFVRKVRTVVQKRTV